ncbi:hypothetical protein ACOMHN_007549 [Nucella lapillus]
MTNTAVSSLEVRDFCPQEKYLLNQTDSNITIRRVNVSEFNSFTFPEFAKPQGVVYGMCGGSCTYCKMQVQLAKVCMGGHVSMIVAADHVLYGHYFHSENMWTSSVTCKVAGFLSILSSEVSVFLIWFIIVDHVIVICFLETSRTSGKWFTVAACTVSWCVGSLLSLVPFLPGLSSWGLQGQAGLCRLAALDNLQSSHGFKWFTVIVILNFMLCLMTVAAAGRCGSVFLLVRGLSKLGSL